MKKLMNYLNQYLNNINTSFNIDEKLVLLLVISIFLPYFITYIIVIGISLYFLIKPKFFNQLLILDGSIFLFILVLFAATISYLNQNYLGLLTSLGMLFIFLAFTFYRSIINRKLFEKAIEIMIFMSIISAIFALFEHTYYVISFENFNNFLFINDKPEYRVKSFFFNSNYYALIILYVQIFCIYKLIKSYENKRYYLIVFIINLIALYFTGSRSAWLILGITIIIIFVFHKKYNYLKIASGFLITGIVATFLKIPIIPRLMDQGFDLGRRADIYNTALIMLSDNYITGKGPSTYASFYYQYADEFIKKFGEESLKGLGLGSQHSHSMFLEIPLSYGIIGIILLFSYFIKIITYLLKALKIKQNFNIVILVISIIIITLLANILDYSIFWIQTGLLFFIIVSSIQIFIKEESLN